jgi:predicted alpha/beta-hydrolase family hydrolase
MKDESRAVTIDLGEGRTVSGLQLAPEGARACYVLAHGAGAGMTHPFLAACAGELGARGIATLRFQFPYMEAKSKRPDPPKVAQGAVRAAVAAAGRLMPGLPLFAGGRSFGGRMASQAQAAEPLPGVVGLAFLGFPLHPAGKPGRERADHLSLVKIPMLFLQGDHDALAELGLLQPVVAGLGGLASLVLFADADHSFHVPARTGRKDAEVRRELLDALCRWIDVVLAGRTADSTGMA